MNKIIDTSHIKFENELFMTQKDIQMWNALSHEEQLTYTIHKEEQSYQSGLAPAQTAAEIMTEARAALKDGL